MSRSGAGPQQEPGIWNRNSDRFYYIKVQHVRGWSHQQSSPARDAAPPSSSWSLSVRSNMCTVHRSPRMYEGRPSQHHARLPCTQHCILTVASLAGYFRGRGFISSCSGCCICCSADASGFPWYLHIIYTSIDVRTD